MRELLQNSVTAVPFVFEVSHRNFPYAFMEKKDSVALCEYILHFQEQLHCVRVACFEHCERESIVAAFREDLSKSTLCLFWRRVTSVQLKKSSF